MSSQGLRTGKEDGHRADALCSGDENDELNYVEFDLSSSPGKRPYLTSLGSPANGSTASIGGNNDIVRTLYKEEKSKPKSAPEAHEEYMKPFVEGPTNSANSDDHDGDEDDNWKDMEVANDEEIYGKHGEVLVQGLLGSDSLGVSTDSFGYTRIAAEQQAQQYRKSDLKTDFLFQKKAKLEDERNVEENSDEDVFSVDEDITLDAQTPLDQLNTTKKFLTDSEKLAYVGLVKLVMIEMAANLAQLATAVSGKSSRSKFVKRLNIAQASMGHWQLKMIERLYNHLEVSEDEIRMIELLSNHGIQPTDLVKSLTKTSLVENPSFQGKKVIGEGHDSGDKTLEIDVSWTVVCDLFLVLVADSVYDSRSRTLLIKFAQYLGIDILDIYQFERRITDSLQIEDSSDQTWNEEEILKSRAKRAKRKKYMYVGLATIGGSLVLGLSAGLLAPVIGAGLAAGLTTIGITGTSGFLAGAGGTALVTVGSTAIGARAGAKGMMKRVGDVKTFEFIPLHNNKRTNLIITVSGWMNSKNDDIRLPFSTIDPVMGDLYSLLWEPEMLQSMGQTIGILASEILTQSIQQILGATILMALMSAIQLPMALSKLTYLVDNPWNVSLDRAWKAGLILADTLISRNLGVRPVTLLGFSLGSRVIYSCLLELSKRGADGLVENVVLFGSPIVGSEEQLILARSVVSGRFVNGYSKKDWILGYLFRATSGGLGRVMGLSAIDKIEGIENFDCTDLVEGHMGYRKAMPKLLSQLDINVLSEEFVEIDEPDPEETERQRKLILEFDEARKAMEEEHKADSKKKNSGWGKWFKPKKKEWWQIYSEKSNETSKEDLREGNRTEEVFNVDEVMRQVQDLKVDADTSTLANNIAYGPPNTLKLAEEQELNDESSTSHSSGKFSMENNLKSPTESKGNGHLSMTFDDSGNHFEGEMEMQGMISNETRSSTIKEESGVPRDVDNSAKDDDESDDEFKGKEENITMSFA